MSKKRIFFIETLLTHGVGHHLDNLIESTLFFKDNHKFDINWLLNANFEKYLLNLSVAFFEIFSSSDFASFNRLYS